MNSHQPEQIELAKKLLKSVRHAAFATVNEDGTPHNSPLMLIYNEDLTKIYIGSNSDALHVKNLMRTGEMFVVLYDSFTKGQGGVYITGKNAHECQGEELSEAMRVHNAVRTRRGSDPIGISYYQHDKPSQRMYSIDISKIEIYSVVRNNYDQIVNEEKVEISISRLL